MKTLKEIEKKSLTELAWKELTEALKPKDLLVNAENGNITLKGKVENYSKKIMAAQIAAGVAGVVSVVNELEVELRTSDHKTDQQLINEIMHALHSYANEPTEAFELKITDDWLMVAGEFENKSGEKISVEGKLCQLKELHSKEQKAIYHPAVITKEEMAYWEIFA